MDIVTIIALGLVQGITEWVPVSSKTQDTFVYLKLFNGDTANVVPILLYLHIGTVLAAIIYFRKELAAMATAFTQKPMDVKAHADGKIGFLFTSLLFTGIVGVPLLLLEKKFFPTLDAGLLFVLMGIGLAVTGVMLAIRKEGKERKVEEAGWRDGILTGLLQGLSVLPGISRSGTSTSGLIWRGFDSESSFHLSFLLSIPTVVLAELLLYVNGSLASFPISDGALLALFSFIFGYLTLGALLRLVRRINLAYVALALGLLMAVVGLLGYG
jgi:undecaprenyl-diphosphatase